MRNYRGRFVIFAALLVRSLAGQTIEFAPSSIPGFQIFAVGGHDDLFAAAVPDSNGRAAISPVLPMSVYVQNNSTRSAVKFVVMYDSIARSPTVRVSLDAVVFDNGEFQGPDLFGSFAAMTSTHAYLMGLLSELKGLAGQPDQNVQANIAAVIQAEPPLGLPNQMVPFLKRTSRARLLQGILTMNGRAEFERMLDSLYKIYSSETVAWKN